MADFVYEAAECVPFRDKEVIARCRRIKREDIDKHPNPDFRIQVVQDEDATFIWFADLISRLKLASDSGEKVVMILPNPWPGYRHVARIINQCRINCKNLWAFAMDEYADQNGNIAPESWEFGFSHAMLKYFYYEIDEELRPPREQFVCFCDVDVNDYSKLLADQGGADICYSGPGWTGHLAFIEPDAPELQAPLEEWKTFGAKIVTLSPFTLAQNSLHGCFGRSGDLSMVPPKAATIGPADVIAAKHRFDTHGITIAGSLSSWQRLTTRLVLHGPVTPLIPESILQTLRTDVYVTETAAMNIETDWTAGY
ncbi:MAG: 6-phosphogluconolactonase [Sedimentisphaeraceae bacterium JB056]